MVSAVRKLFNNAYSEEKYRALLKELDDLYPGAIEFRLAETPVFINKVFSAQMLYNTPLFRYQKARVLS